MAVTVEWAASTVSLPMELVGSVATLETVAVAVMAALAVEVEVVAMAAMAAWVVIQRLMMPSNLEVSAVMAAMVGPAVLAAVAATVETRDTVEAEACRLGSQQEEDIILPQRGVAMAGLAGLAVAGACLVSGLKFQRSSDLLCVAWNTKVRPERAVLAAGNPTLARIATGGLQRLVPALEARSSSVTVGFIWKMCTLSTMKHRVAMDIARVRVIN